MLAGTSVGLRPLGSADLPLLHTWINDRQHVLSGAPYRPVSDVQHHAWFTALQQRSDLVIFGIERLDEQVLIGSCQLHSIHPVHRSAELQIRIGDAAARGHGYGTEATRLLLRFGFRDLHLHRIFLHVFATNPVAIRTYEKVGMVTEGTLRRAAFIDGQYVDVRIMGILREEFHA